MPLRTIASFAVAIFLGLIAVILVRGVITSQKPGAGPSATGPTAPVVVAAVPVERGTKLTPAMLKVVAYPRDALPTGAFQTLDTLVGKTAPSRTVERSLAANEPVLDSKLSGAGAKTNLSATIDPGMRAVSVRSSDVAGVAGFVLPGDRVDVLLTRTIGANDNANSVTQVLAQNALVLGVDQTSDQEADKPLVVKAVTVEVTPEQAQSISLGGIIGQISLSLRQSSDHAPLTRQTTSVADLGGVAHPAPAVRRKIVKPVLGMTEIHVVRGVTATAYSIGGS